MKETFAAAININEDYCGRCSICHAICPFEAINRDTDTGKVEIDLPKCQLCGICYSACPVTAIEILYYDYSSLVEYVNNARKKSESDTVILMCRGNSPPTCEIEEIMLNEGFTIDDYIPLRLPCSGRLPTEFIFKILQSGVKRIVSIQCDDEFCRFKEGTKISTKRLLLGKAVLEQLGLNENSVKIVKYSRKVIYDTDKCVGCDKCVFICPYEAIEAESFATPKIDLDKCMGCGACALVCPHHAIQVRGFEFEDILKRYTESARKLRAQNGFPVVLIFICQWSEFSPLDEPENQLYKNVISLEIPCFKALDPAHIANALHDGFDGVMAVVCPSDDCKLEEGKDTAERNLAVLENYLKKMNLLHRFEIFTLSPRNIEEFNQKLGEFNERIRSMPPLKSSGCGGLE